MDAERLAWIDHWCAGWEAEIDPSDYAQMPLSVALGFVRELMVALGPVDPAGKETR